jgi:putative ABC transport system substrate-binding protein
MAPGRMKRRAFLSLLAGAAAPSILRPLAASAQQSTGPVIGFLSSRSQIDSEPETQAFRAGLAEVGYAEGQNLAIDYRWADGQYDRLPALAADLVRRQVAVIFCGGPPAAKAAKTATPSIPVVFVSGDDPIRSGLVASINRPGANVTGVSILTGQLGAKQLGLLREIVPNAAVVALLVNPNVSLTEGLIREVQVAAATSGHRIHVVTASSESDLGKSFATVADLQPGALIVAADPFFFDRREQIVALAADRAIPAIYELREFAVAGGLMSYGGRITDWGHQAGIQTGRILAGAKPADLPVHQATKLELFINLKTAKVLGLEMPATLLARADEVIE